MRRWRIKQYCAAALFACCLFLLCGCAWIGQALDGLTPDETEAPSATKAPEATEAPEAVSADNPVFLFFTGFYKVYGRSADGLLEAVIESGGEEALRLYMQAMKDEAFISLVYASVGMLSDTDGAAAFSGTLTGAYAGSGRLTSAGGFSYVFDSGGEISGTLKDGVLRCEVSRGGADASVVIVRTRSAYYAWVMDEDETSAAEIKQGSFRYARFENVLLADFIETEFPTAANVPVLSYIGGSLWVSE